ncbi:tetratricopeptide repeat protein [Candidatus Daviesbacteria bacterium]|nr:tetratricopeptide repeat protein [Candidatus Daviesbacteria bacterium]
MVILALFFYLFPALAFVTTNSNKVYNFKLPVPYPKVVRVILLFFIFYFLFSIFQLWYSDTLFARAEKASDLGMVGRAYNLLIEASNLNPLEPLYRSELGLAAAAAGETLTETDATSSADLKKQAVNQTSRVLQQNPRNTSFWRTAVRTYAELGDLEGALSALDQTIKLAPTDPKLYYNKGLVLQQMGQSQEAQAAFKKAVELKPNYQEVLNEIN